MTIRRSAKLHRLLQHRIEHWREIAGRRIDDAQDLGGGGLLLQRIAQFGKQPDIFNRYDGLIGKGFK